jgi:TRAP transporter 4TM/12TM fusion protein
LQRGNLAFRGIFGQTESTLEKITAVIAVAMCVYHLLFVSGIFHYLGIYIQLQPHRAVSLAFFLALTFLLCPARKGLKRDRVPWYDILFIIAGLVPTGYYAFFYDLVQYHQEVMGVATPAEGVFCLLLMIVMLESGRRVLGNTMPILALFFIMHSLFTDYFPSILFGKAFSIERLVAQYYLSSEGLFGLPLGVASTIIVAFIIFSQLMFSSGASKFMLNVALSLFGRLRGGPAKVAIFASALMASISGSVSGNVAVTGSVTIPLMKSIGYKPHYAGAVEAVASKGGIFTPPVMGAVAFLMAEMTGVTYARICLAAALPALLYFLAVFCQVDFQAAKLGMKGLRTEELPQFWSTLWKGWYYLLPIAGLIIFIVVLSLPLHLAAFYTTVVLWIATVFRKESRLTPSKIAVSFVETGKIAINAFIPCALAGIILGSLFVTGFGVRFSSSLLDLAGGSTAILVILTAIACFILGMGMTSIPIYITLAILVAPALMEVGVHIIAAHLFIIYWAVVSFITPPVAIAAYVASGIAGADPMKIAWQACRLGIISFLIPFFFIFRPALLMVGSKEEIAFAVITSIMGTLPLAAGLEGYGLDRLGWIERVMLAIGGVLLIYPGWITDVIGVALVAPVGFVQITKSRKLSVHGAFLESKNASSRGGRNV